MVDLSKLDPVTTAQHLGNPEGEIGVAIGDQMNKLRPDGIMMTGSITPESAAQFAFMRYGFRFTDESLLREMHSTAGFRHCDVQRHRTKTVNLAGVSIQYDHFSAQNLL